MLLTISNILSEEGLSRAMDLVAALDWRDGAVTAGRTAKAVKKNEQADLSSPGGQTLSKNLLTAISEHAVVKAAARPKLFSTLLVSRTADAGRYGAHIDNALMRKNGQWFRTDLSFTLFLSDPSDYDGGELIIHNAGAIQEIKGEAGDMVLYPSTSIHEVAPVTRGERIVCAGWIESMICDEAQRDMLFDLENLRVSLRSQMAAQSAEILMLDKTIANLLRMWAAP